MILGGPALGLIMAIRIRRSLETENKKLAQAIEAKIMMEIIEGKFFEKPLEQRKTFKDLITKFMAVHGPTVSEICK